MTEPSTAYNVETMPSAITPRHVSAILGSSKTMTREGAMRDLVRSYHGAENEFQGNIATNYRASMIDGALADLGIETGLNVGPCAGLGYEHWAFVRPDGVVDSIQSDKKTGVTVRTPFNHRATPAPIEFVSVFEQAGYFDQVQFCLWVSGLDNWIFYQWAPSDSRVEYVTPDPEWQREALSKVRQFYAEYVDELAGDVTGHLEPLRTEIDTPEAAKMVHEWDELTEAIENATERRKDLLADMVKLAGEKNSIIAGRNLTLTVKSGSVSYKKALDHYAPGADLSKFKGAPSQSWGLKG